MDKKLHKRSSKPRRIILIRHGECHANTDKSKFATEPDYTIELTGKRCLLSGVPVQLLKI